MKKTITKLWLMLFIVSINLSLQAKTVITTVDAPTNVTATPSTISLGSSSNLNATSTGNQINWYNIATGGSPLTTVNSGVNYSVSPSSTTIYYAEAYGNVTTALNMATSWNTSTYSVFFNITTGNTPVSISGFTWASNTGGANESVNVYTKNGTYSGYEKNSGSWTNQGSFPASATNPEILNITAITIPANTTYGFCLYCSYIFDFLCSSSASNVSDSKITVTSGSIGGTSDNPFTLNQTNVTMDGSVKYLSGTSTSATRTPVTVTVNQVPTATTSAASSISSTAATLNGSVNANNASTAVTFQYGTTASYGTSVTATPSPVTGSSATAVSYALSGLMPNTTYYYRIVGVNTVGTTNGTGLTFTTTAAVPTATTNAATTITTTGATLNGSVNPKNASTAVSFDYGTSISYGTNVTATQSPVTGTTATAVSYTLSGLTPNTTYHFRVNGVNSAGATNGTDLTFTTTAAVPTATTNAATTITTTGATLNGSVNPKNASTAVSFDYGTSISYGTNVTATQSPVTGTTATAVSYVLSGLVPNTTYHFRVNGINTAGTTNGTDLTFTTTAVMPTATSVAASSITSTGAALNGSINANNASTVVTFDYGTTTSYGTNVTAIQSPVTGTTATAVSYVLTGLVPNTTYHFRVNGVNSVGTTNGTDLTFTTTAVVPTATTSAATTITTTGATLNGSVNANNAGTAVTFQYGTTIGYGSTVTATQNPVTGSTATAVSYPLSGLTPNTTYHYRVVGVNTAGTTNGTDQTFTTTAAVPTATTNSASTITTTGATLNGSVNANNASTAVTFDYGLTTSYGSTVTAVQSPVTGSTATAVSYALSGLTPNTTYHYRVVGVNTAGTTNGNDQTFTTTAAVPTATTNSASTITTTGATLNGSVNANNTSTTVTFDYGLTTSYGSTVTAVQSPVTGSTATAVSYALSGLTPNTTYHYRVVGVNTAGTTNGTDLTFTTTAVEPTATTSAATTITTTGATLNGSVNANNASTAVTFQYGTTIGYGSTVTATQSPVTGSTATAVSYPLSGLTPNTTYHYRVVGVNTAGTTNGTDLTFTTTAVVPTATTSAATTITTTGATLNGSVNANNTSTTVTFDYGLTTSYGTSGTAAQSPVTGITATAVSYALSGLTPNTTYHFRVNGVNSFGTTNGTDLTFTTTAAVPTATTNAATTITTTGAMLNGSVNANNASTTVTFDYGLTTSYGTSGTAVQSPVTGTTATAVSYALSGLTPNTTYHFRVNGVNAGGTTIGLDQSFTTLLYSGGTGTSVSPYQIATLTDLRYLSEHSGDWNKYFIQTANIDATATSGWNSNVGFSPIGTLYTIFTGSYNGQNYTINALYINRPTTDYIGLFGYTTGNISNLGLINVYIKGQICVGGLVGYTQSGTISNAYTTGTVIGNSIASSNGMFGGLVGYNGSGVTITDAYSTATVSGIGFGGGGLVGRNDGTITNSYATGSVGGNGTYLGGLAGYNYGIITNSYATGIVSGTGDNFGGLVGRNDKTITNTYAKGNVIGTNMVGGLVGYNLQANGNNANISNSYSIGSVTGTSSLGGLVGVNSNGTVTNCFWNTETSGRATSQGGTGKTTAQMKTLGTFTGWDFMFETANGTNDYWGINALDNGGYPFLAWQGFISIPATQASALVFSSVQTTQMTINWTNGTGSSRAVFVKAANTGTATPVNNTTYTANTTFSSGTQIGSTGWYCIYNGTGTSVTVTGLSLGTNYIAQIFDYNGAAGLEKYNTATATDNPKSQTTVGVPTVTTNAVTTITATGATLNSSVNANNASTTVTFDYGTTTSYGSTVTATPSPVTGTIATAVSYALSGLTPNTTYHFRVNGVNSAGTTNGLDQTFTTTIGTGLDENGNQQIAVYPNPATDAFHIVGLGGVSSISLTDLSGRTLLQKQVSDSEAILVSTLPKGVYILKIKNNEGTTERKVVKK
jgi:phosphodiesterase/alkaline phosphatase D-like protein